MIATAPTPPGPIPGRPQTIRGKVVTHEFRDGSRRYVGTCTVDSGESTDAVDPDPGKDGKP